jgi:hypothetical protein
MRYDCDNTMGRFAMHRRCLDGRDVPRSMANARLGVTRALSHGINGQIHRGAATSLGEVQTSQSNNHTQPKISECHWCSLAQHVSARGQDDEHLATTLQRAEQSLTGYHDLLHYTPALTNITSLRYIADTAQLKLEHCVGPKISPRRWCSQLFAEVVLCGYDFCSDKK